MNKLSLFLILFAQLQTANLFSQSEFAPIGAEWVYNIEIDFFDGFPDPLEDYYILTSTGDTVIDQISYRKVGNYLFHQEGEKVWFLHDEKLNLIYDFGLQPGDTAMFTFFTCNYELVTCNYITLSVDTVNISGQPLRYFRLHELGSCSAIYRYYYYDKIGSLRQLIEHYATCTFIPEFRPEWLRCYKDSIIDFKSPGFLFFNQPDCYYTPPSAVTIPESGSFSIMPNPVTDILHIQSAGQPITSVAMMDAYGKMIGNHTTNASIVDIPMENYPPGIYFCRVQSGEQWAVKRIVKTSPK